METEDKPETEEQIFPSIGFVIKTSTWIIKLKREKKFPIHKVNTRIIGPDGLISLSLLILTLRQKNITPFFPDIANECLEKLKDYNIINLVNPDYVQPRILLGARNSPLFPVTKITPENRKDQLKEIYNHMRSRFPQKDFTEFESQIEAIIDNVYKHSGSLDGAYLTYYVSRKPDMLHLAIGDLGIGIPASVNRTLKQAGKAKESDISIVCKAFRGTPGIKEEPTKTGKGLNNLYLFMRRNDGRIRIFTRDITLDRIGAFFKDVPEWENVEKLRSEGINGTIVTLRLIIDNLPKRRLY